MVIIKKFASLTSANRYYVVLLAIHSPKRHSLVQVMQNNNLRILIALRMHFVLYFLLFEAVAQTCYECNHQTGSFSRNHNIGSWIFQNGTNQKTKRRQIEIVEVATFYVNKNKTWRRFFFLAWHSMWHDTFQMVIETSWRQTRSCVWNYFKYETHLKYLRNEEENMAIFLAF